MKILLFENQFSDVLISRISYARFLKNKGYKVYICCDFDSELENLCVNEGFCFFGLENVRNMNPLIIFLSILKVRKFLKKEEITFIHCFRFQPILIGTFSSLFKKTKVINHITGLGTYFTGKGLKNKVMSTFIKQLYRFNNKVLRAKTIVQNPDDKKDLGLNCIVVKGSSTDEYLFNNKVKANNGLVQEFSNYDRVFFFASRLLKSKGVLNLVEAFLRYCDIAKFKTSLIIAGEPDGKNPDSISENDFNNIKKSKNIYLTGRINNVNEYIAMSTCSIFPSMYREGIPRFLIESLAMSKPIITTNTPGNKEAYADNGVLINDNSVNMILKSFCKFEELDVKTLEQRSHELYIKEFSQNIIYNQLMKLYC